MQLKTDKMIASKDNGIGWMIFNNPERRNAMSLAMREAMAEIFDTFAKDDEVRVLVLRGAGGKAFVSGADISEFKEKRNSADAEALYGEAVARSRKAMLAFDKPIIAMIEGFCVGGGMATALDCDIRLASDDSEFAIPAARLGLAYSFENLRQLSAVVGPAYAKQILFTGSRLPAKKALEIGLVNDVVPRADLEGRVRAMAGEIVANAPLTIKSAKFTIGEVYKDESIRDLKRVDTLMKACFDSQDFKEGREAFMEKRKPNFQGR
jgi:enoyl-CoA hydratase/carnithine racemase